MDVQLCDAPALNSSRVLQTDCGVRGMWLSASLGCTNVPPSVVVEQGKEKSLNCLSPFLLQSGWQRRSPVEGG